MSSIQTKTLNVHSEREMILNVVELTLDLFNGMKPNLYCILK